MKPPRYWRRGLLAGVVVWFIMSNLVSHLDTRNQKMIAEGNIDIPAGTNSTQVKDDPAVPRRRQTDFGRMMGVLIFALFCVIPEHPVNGPTRKTVGQPTPEPVKAETAPASVGEPAQS